MHDIKSTWLKTAATQYRVQLGLPDKRRAFEELVVCYVAWL